MNNPNSVPDRKPKTALLICLGCNGIAEFGQLREYKHTVHEVIGCFRAHDRHLGDNCRTVWRCVVCRQERVYGTGIVKPFLAPLENWSWLPAHK